MKALVPLLALALAACQTTVTEPPPPPLPSPTACAVIESRDWAAWINRMPGPDARATLHVTGEIDVPTPGYTAILREGIADRSAVPMQQLVLELTAPAGMVAQVVTTQLVRYEGPAIAQRYRGVSIMCAGRRIAHIADIQDAH